jgi:hypothetical protein
VSSNETGISMTPIPTQMMDWRIIILIIKASENGVGFEFESPVWRKESGRLTVATLLTVTTRTTKYNSKSKCIYIQSSRFFKDCLYFVCAHNDFICSSLFYLMNSFAHLFFIHVSFQSTVVATFAFPEMHWFGMSSCRSM